MITAYTSKLTNDANAKVEYLNTDISNSEVVITWLPKRDDVDTFEDLKTPALETCLKHDVDAWLKLANECQEAHGDKV